MIPRSPADWRKPVERIPLLALGATILAGIVVVPATGAAPRERVAMHVGAGVRSMVLHGAVRTPP